MLGAASVISSFAQNVYSVNVVGYITLTLTNTYTMIANQLDDGAGNYATNLFSAAPPGMIFSKFTGTGYANLTKTASSWSGTTSLSCAPGEGLFVKKPVNPASVNLTLVGEVLQGDLVNGVVPGYDIYGCMVPQQGGVSSIHNYPRTTGDLLSRYTGTGYRNYTVVPGTTGSGTNKWSPSEPVIDVGEGFWIRGMTTTNWTRTFQVQ